MFVIFLTKGYQGKSCLQNDGEMDPRIRQVFLCLTVAEKKTKKIDFGDSFVRSLARALGITKWVWFDRASLCKLGRVIFYSETITSLSDLRLESVNDKKRVKQFFHRDFLDETKFELIIFWSLGEASISNSAFSIRNDLLRNSNIIYKTTTKGSLFQ